MKTKWLKKKMKYDGRQLHSLANYLDHGLQGDSVIAFEGPCDVPFEHMVDGEDLLEKSAIRGSRMLHFIFEIFDRELVTGVFLQRLFASLCLELIEKQSGVRLVRRGDDLYWGSKKLSISIATSSPVSVLVHFALNISTRGTPVKTTSLEELKIEPSSFALQLLKKISEEYESILQARVKVRPVL
jgi:hypothetical protein